MARKTKEGRLKPKERTHAKRFKETARRIGVEESEFFFEEVFSEITHNNSGQ